MKSLKLGTYVYSTNGEYTFMYSVHKGNPLWERTWPDLVHATTGELVCISLVAVYEAGRPCPTFTRSNNAGGLPIQKQDLQKFRPLSKKQLLTLALTLIAAK